ncbi:MAG: SRPBCC family protein [Pseudonocardiaceae bacterium]
MNETLRTVDGRPVLRIERRLAHPPEKVWRALTEPAQLSQWYPFRVSEMDLRTGGKIRFDDGQGTTMGAVITELDPPRVFAFSEHAPAEMVRESDDLVHFELRPEGEGCLLIFTHTFDDRPAAASYATGWHGCLDALDMLLDGRPVEWPDSMVERYEAYVEAFGLAEGSAELTSDGWQVRFERQLIQQPIDKVWATLSSAPAAPVVGGPVPQGFTTGEIPAAAVTAVDAPTLLEYGWQVEDRPAGRVRWELSDGPGGARIVLTQTGPGELAEERSTALAAWQTHIELLAKQLPGTELPGTAH